MYVRIFYHYTISLFLSFYTCSGEEEYSCVWFESRGPNIMEFQMGLRPSTTPSFELCDNSHFLRRTWNTQTRELFSPLPLLQTLRENIWPWNKWPLRFDIQLTFNNKEQKNQPFTFMQLYCWKIKFLLLIALHTKMYKICADTY